MAKRDPFPSEKLDQYMLRFPDGMRERLKVHAAANKRSLNAEIIARLEATLPDPDRDRRRELELLKERENDIQRQMSYFEESLEIIRSELQRIKERE